MANPIVKIKIKDLGTITAELYPKDAPITVENFISLAKSGFYEGLIFHRVIAGFMIQGGGFDTSFQQKKAPSIKGEFLINGIPNPIRHERGVLSMARTQVKDSASSQFFIMHADSAFLDGQYAAFGKVTDGMEIVDKIAASKTSSYGWYNDVPVEAVVIESVTVDA
ncbi:MAG: peptidylprolyl isomerase [Clostridia bacterium]|nr:peptidylprolyl isomerase [Clostridia bacterium]